MRKPQQQQKANIPGIDYLKEFLMTFSSQPSLFSSKKIERFIAFFVMLVISIIYLSKNMGVIKPLEFVEIVSLWLAYGGYNSAMNLRDKKLNASIAQSQLDSEDGEPAPVVVQTQTSQTQTTQTSQISSPTIIPPINPVPPLKPDVPENP